MELSVFVVLKDGRRLEDISYLERSSAENRVKKHKNALISSHKKMGIKSNYKFEIVETTKPNKIW